MAITEVSVINEALVLLGADVISSRTQSTPRAEKMDRIFDTTRDSVLRAHRWRFAKKRAAPISADSTTPNSTYDYRYQLPSDCLRVLGIATDIDGDEDDDAIWEVEADRYLLTNESTFYLIYIYQATNPSDWDDVFAEALAAKLAYKAAYGITQSVAVMDRMEKVWKDRIAHARSYDSMEGSTRLLISDDWIDARR